MDEEKKDFFSNLCSIIGKIEAGLSRSNKTKSIGGGYMIKNFEIFPGLWAGFFEICIGDELSVIYHDTGLKKSLRLRTKEKAIVISEIDSGLKIKEEIKFFPDYPHFQSEWEWDEKENDLKGILTFFRVDLNESTFVNYYGRNFLWMKYYKVFNPKKIDLSRSKLPKNLGKVSEVLGQSIAMKIDFNKKIKEIMEMSRLEDVSRELDSIKK